MTTIAQMKAEELNQSAVNRHRYLLAGADLSKVTKTSFFALCQTLDGTFTTQIQEAKNGLLSSIHAEIAVQHEALDEGEPFVDDVADFRILVGVTCKRLLDAAKIIGCLDAVQCLALLARVEEVLASEVPRALQAEIVFNKMQASNHA